MEPKLVSTHKLTIPQTHMHTGISVDTQMQTTLLHKHAQTHTHTHTHNLCKWAPEAPWHVADAQFSCPHPVSSPNQCSPLQGSSLAVDEKWHWWFLDYVLLSKYKYTFDYTQFFVMSCFSVHLHLLAWDTLQGFFPTQPTWECVIHVGCSRALQCGAGLLTQDSDPVAEGLFLLLKNSTFYSPALFGCINNVGDRRSALSAAALDCLPDIMRKLKYKLEHTHTHTHTHRHTHTGAWWWLTLEWK